MRLMHVDTAVYAVYRAETVQRESRPGTKNEYIARGTVKGQLTPIRDSFSVELYGDKVSSMYNLICEKGADIQLNDKVQYGSNFYKVVAVLIYTTHVTAQIERTGAL